MQLTITTDDSRDQVLQAVGAMFGVRLAVVEETASASGGEAQGAVAGQSLEATGEDAQGEGERVTKTRH